MAASRLLSPSRSGRMSFTAQGRASSWWRARHTSPMPPSPSFVDQAVVAERQPLVEERLVDLQHRLARGGHRPLEEALQLAHVAGPAVRAQAAHDSSEMRSTTAPTRRACWPTKNRASSGMSSARSASDGTRSCCRSSGASSLGLEAARGVGAEDARRSRARRATGACLAPALLPALEHARRGAPGLPGGSRWISSR